MIRTVDDSTAEGHATEGQTNKFDSYLLIVQEICTLKDDTKRAFSNLLSDTVMDTNNVGGRRRHVEANVWFHLIQAQENDVLNLESYIEYPGRKWRLSQEM